MPLTELVAQAFSAQGPLARAQPHFRPREGQVAMAAAVADAITRRSRLVVEAGTGVGKTFAYLVPALLSGERVVVSTATKALQDQLHARDLPLLLRALALPVRVALLKGRSSYLCLHRLKQARHQGAGGDAPALARIELWAQATRTGDLAELPGMDERSPLMARVTSTRDNCLGQECPRFRQCHVHLARREALQADVVVINHHLFFADLAVRESGMAQLLPSARVVVFDEAHQLADTAAQFFGTQFSTAQLLDLGQDLVGVGHRHAPGFADWVGLQEALREAARALRLASPPAGQGRVPWPDRLPQGVDAARWPDALRGVVDALRAALAGLDQVAAHAPDLAHLHGRAVTLLERLTSLSSEAPAATVRWLEAAGALRLTECPLDVAPALRALWQGSPVEQGAWEEPDGAAEGDGGPDAKAWVFTSATLGDDTALRWFTEACGLEDARVLRVASPFDHARQAALYVPPDLPVPTDPAHGEHLAAWIGDAVARLGGRTLVLTTSLRALDTIASALQRRFAPGGAIEVLVQGQAPKRQIMERFRAPSGGYVLVGSATFWEGFDVPGSALQLVVIDKLPFPSPGDPLVQARGQRLEQEGRSAFRDHALPAAAVALKQGAGRLIRHESDTGILVVGDARLLRMGYGKRLLRALPAMRRLESQGAFEQALDALREGREFEAFLASSA